MVCGKELMSEEAAYCSDCRRKKHKFLQNRALFRYTKEAKDSIVRFKFHNKQEYADYYATLCVREMKQYLERIKPDVIIPVPMHRAKRRKRGYNQAEVFASRLFLETKIPLETELLYRRKNTSPLKEITKEQRLEELQQAFYVDKEKLSNYECILLIDDIYTTGATLDACAKALLAGGAKRVYGITLAIGAGKV